MTALIAGFAAGLVLLVAGGEALVRGASRLAGRLGVPPLLIGLTVVAFGTSAPELAVTVGAAWGGGTVAELAMGNVVGSNIFNVLAILGLSAAITPLVVAVRLVRLEVPIMIAVSLVAAGLAADGRLGRLDGALLFGGFLAYLAFTIVEAHRERLDRVNRGAARTEGSARRVAADTGWIVVGLALLVAGARWLVDSSAAAAQALGVSEVVIGLTIVAAGTSLPEVATSVLAGLRGQRDIAVGNVVGSNLFNLLSVLGFTALVAPAGIPVPPSVLAFDLPVMIAVAVACLPVFFTGFLIARWEGLVFLAYYAAYTTYLVMAATHHDALDLFSLVVGLFVLPITLLTVVIGVTRQLRAR